MPIDIDYEAAADVLRRAIARAHSSDELPLRWIAASERIARHSSNATFVFALGTALLAKATDARVDTLALKKVSDQARAYTARQVGHRVLRPVAYIEHGIHLGVTGREPLNNQPFFRYNRIDEMERVRDIDARDDLVGVLTEADGLSSNQAFEALAAFLRTRIELTNEITEASAREVPDDVLSVAEAGGVLATEYVDGGKVGQALVAACLDLVYEEVLCARVNDPSRRWPGDVQGFEEGQLIISAEVRQKLSEPEDVIQFAADISQRGHRRGLYAAFAAVQEPLDAARLRKDIWHHFGVYMTVVSDPTAFILECVGWSTVPISDVAAVLTERVISRLVEIEASDEAIDSFRTMASPRL